MFLIYVEYAELCTSGTCWSESTILGTASTSQPLAASTEKRVNINFSHILTKRSDHKFCRFFTQGVYWLPSCQVSYKPAPAKAASRKARIRAVCNGLLQTTTTSSGVLISVTIAPLPLTKIAGESGRYSYCSIVLIVGVFVCWLQC